MEQRKEFLEAAIRGEHSFTELCRRFGISRKNGYKWLNRYRDEIAFPGGKMSFDDRSRRPHNSPKAISAEVEATIVDVRKQRPHWGPKKLRVILAKQCPELEAAVGEHVRRRVEAQRLSEASAEADEEHTVHGAAWPRAAAERRLVDRLQG